MSRPWLPRLDPLDVPPLRRRRRAPISWTRDESRPLVVAHRGASSDRAEHTLAAYTQALEDGADGLECDVRLTADGHLVCVHDRRIDRTSNGVGPVSSAELTDLERLDWTSWKHPWQDLDDEAPERDTEGGVLTLDRLLSTVHDWGRRVELSIETKHPTRYAGLVERRLVELLDRYGWARPRRGESSPARVMSFSWFSLRRCLELAPAVERVYLMDRVPLRFRDGSLPLGASVAGPSMAVVRAHPEYVERAHVAGHDVHVWVANDPKDVELCALAGVDAIVTDRPAAVIAQLGGPT